MFNNPKEQAEDYLEFLAYSPSPYHAAWQLGERLKKIGYQQIAETEPWPKKSGKYFFVREGAVMAFSVPDTVNAENFSYRIVGAHTDSPTFKLKPLPASTTTTDGWNQLEVEIYGGMLTNSWLDRDLGLAGRVVTADGQIYLVKTPAIARIAQLAIHLDHSIISEGLHLDRQQHLHPIWGFGETESIYEYLSTLLAEGKETLSLTPQKTVSSGKETEIVASDLFFYDAAGPAFLGRDKEFIAGAKQDNLSSVHAALCALENADSSAITVLAAFDHEEIGSSTRAGAAGPILEDVLVRTATALGADPEQYRAALARSFCISADAGHWVHPNYVDRHDPSHHPVPGAGPLLKINAIQRYATEAVGSARWDYWCKNANVPYQNFVSNNESPCGSTIGPITATRLGITTVDVGVGLLSMHSARELSHRQDNYYLAAALNAFWSE